jgi:hypothetical protein
MTAQILLSIVMAGIKQLGSNEQETSGQSLCLWWLSFAQSSLSLWLTWSSSILICPVCVHGISSPFLQLSTTPLLALHCLRQWKLKLLWVWGSLRVLPPGSGQRGFLWASQSSLHQEQEQHWCWISICSHRNPTTITPAAFPSLTPSLYWHPSAHCWLECRIAVGFDFDGTNQYLRTSRFPPLKANEARVNWLIAGLCAWHPAGGLKWAGLRHSWKGREAHEAKSTSLLKIRPSRSIFNLKIGIRAFSLTPASNACLQNIQKKGRLLLACTECRHQIILAIINTRADYRVPSRE